MTALAAKICSRCGELKELTQFYRHRRDGYFSACIPCSKQQSSDSFSKRREERLRAKVEEQRRRTTRMHATAEYAAWGRRRHLQQYGLTPEKFDEMREAQGGCCAFCGEPKKRLVVDHCHKTGNVRGLLCVRCNVALGYFESLRDAGELQKAEMYVRGLSLAVNA